MKFNLAEIKEKLMATFGLEELEADEILAYLQQGMAMTPMLAQVLPPFMEMGFEILGNFKPLVERPKGFATDLDIARFKKYITDGEMTREEALALTIARMNRNTSINIKQGTTTVKSLDAGTQIAKKGGEDIPTTTKPFAVDDGSITKEQADELKSGLDEFDFKIDLSDTPPTDLSDLDKGGHL